MLPCGRMSKAFTRESDGHSDLPVLPRPASSLPPGAKNYLTRGGQRKLREELDRLRTVERPEVAARAAAEPDTRANVQALDQRILQLEESLQTAVVVDPPVDGQDKVSFGATVVVREKNGEIDRYRIVGVDETDIDQGWVSWVSPIARALLNTRPGDRVRVQRPAGPAQLEVVSVTFDPEPPGNEISNGTGTVGS
jgi:transcription elongation factor GreB